MRSRTVMCAVVAAVLFAAAAHAQPLLDRGAGTTQPNVLILFTDDQMWATLGSDTKGVVKTPNLDRLASQGVKFTRFAANHPICTVSRATLQTGQYARVHGALFNNSLLDPPHTTYLAEVFQHAGYKTGYIGKWHMDGGEDANGNFELFFRPVERSWVRPSRRRGYEEWNGYECCQFHDQSFHWDDGVTPPLLVYTPELGWELEMQRIFLQDFMQRHTIAGEPWMYMMGIGTPHVPMLAPQAYLDMYDPATLPLPAWMPANVPPDKEAFARETLRTYYAMVSFIDAQVGMILDDIDDLGIANNTIVVFSSDNGNHLGQHWDDFFGYDESQPGGTFQGKGYPTSNSIRVPLIMRWPGHIPAGKKVDALMGMVDMAPTILSLAGLPPHWRMQGLDMSPWALGKKGPQRDAIWMTHDRLLPPSWEAMWTGRYIYSQGQVQVLYDLQNDPLERHNLYGDPSVSLLQFGLGSELAGLKQENARAPEFPNISAAEHESQTQYADAFPRGTDEALIDGMPVRAYLALAIAVGSMDNQDEILRDALLSAYAQNLDMFDNNDFVRARQFRQLLAIGLSTSSELREFLLAEIEDQLGESLQGSYVSTSCEPEGPCSPVDPFTPPVSPVVTRGIEEPLAGSGDADLDGITNAQEYANAVAAGTGVRGFARAAVDATLDGTEPGPSSSSSSNCFIATAAYGTPLAPQLDQLRGFRDQWLLSNPFGATFTDTYYRLSPPAAHWIALHPFAMSAARSLIAVLLAPRMAFAALASILVAALVRPVRRQLRN